MTDKQEKILSLAIIVFFVLLLWISFRALLNTKSEKEVFISPIAEKKETPEIYVEYLETEIEGKG